MRMRCILFFVGLSVIILFTSCGTTGGKQVETVIYDMHRRVTKLDKNFDNINSTFAELSVKLDETDRLTKQLQSVIEENQVKINQLSNDLSELKTTLYRHLNLSVGGTPGGLGRIGREAVGNVEILPPSAAQPPEIQPKPAPVGTPSPAEPRPTPATPPPRTSGPVAEIEQPLDTPQTPPRTTPPTTPPSTPTPSPASQPTPTPVAKAEPATVQPTTVTNPKDDYLEAQRLYANGKYEEALARFDQHIKTFPNEESAPNAQFWKAKCLLNLNRYQDAIKEFETLKNNYPTHSKVPIAMQNEAVAYQRIGDTNKAIQLLQEIIDKYPLSPYINEVKSDLEKLKSAQGIQQQQ